MKDERTIDEAREAIRHAVAKIGMPNHDPEVDKAIDQLVAALLSSSGKR